MKLLQLYCYKSDDYHNESFIDLNTGIELCYFTNTTYYSSLPNGTKMANIEIAVNGSRRSILNDSAIDKVYEIYLEIIKKFQKGDWEGILTIEKTEVTTVADLKLKLVK